VASGAESFAAAGEHARSECREAEVEGGSR